MKTTTVVLALQLIDLPAKRHFSHHSVFLTKDGEVGEEMQITEPSVRFELEPGTYTATGSSLADDGSVLSGPFSSEPITIKPPTSAEVMRSLTITFAEVDPKTADHQEDAVKADDDGTPAATN